MIDRKNVIQKHNPVLSDINIESPLTVGNGEFAFTADITGLQTLYDEYDVVPLCTMSTWGWHTKPVSEAKKEYTLDDLWMTEYQANGRTYKYPVDKKAGNEDVYSWLRENPHRLNLARIRLFLDDQTIKAAMLNNCSQKLDLYTGVLNSSFTLAGELCEVETVAHAFGKDVLGVKIHSNLLSTGRLKLCIDFPYGSSQISGSDWDNKDMHSTSTEVMDNNSLKIRRRLDDDNYSIVLGYEGHVSVNERHHKITINTADDTLEVSLFFSQNDIEELLDYNTVKLSSEKYWDNFWNEGGFISLEGSKDLRANELERRIILSQYLMAVNCSGTTPPQETGLTCNSWYGKMHLEMYLWHCSWLILWNHTTMAKRSLAWYKTHINEARINAKRNGYKGVRWPKMIANEGIDCPSPVAPLLIWQQPHIIFMIEMLYQAEKSDELLREYWEVVKETADFMADFVVWNDDTHSYDIAEPFIPVQECHKPPMGNCNPAFELEYFVVTLSIALKWCDRLEQPKDPKWVDVMEHMSEMTYTDDGYLAHKNCPDTFTLFNRDHPSMLGSFGIIDSGRVDQEVMRRTLNKVQECWKYETLWGWDFAMMAMTAIRLSDPELAINLLLMDTFKNCYLPNGNNMQISRKDLPLYLPGNGSLLYVAAMMTAGYTGCKEVMPGFPKNDQWKVDYEKINPFL